MKRKPDPYLRCMPWKILAAFSPFETVLATLEKDGTVESAGRSVVFKEDMRGGWYDLVAALRGIIQFHELAQKIHGIPASFASLTRFANKLDAGSPVFEQDLADVRADIASCKRQAMQLRLSEATSIVDTVRIDTELQLAGLKEAS